MIEYGLIGLTTRDKRVYESLLTMDNASIRSISDVTGINRGSVYESLKSLLNSGLVSHIAKGKVIRYQAEDPEKLHELISERKRRLSKAHKNVDAYIKQLASTQIAPSIFQFASFYDGDEGLANILRDVLSTCRLQDITEYRVISSPRVSEYLYNNFKHFTQERIKQKLHVKIIRQGKTERGEADMAKWKNLLDYPGDTGCYTLIYGTKTALVSIDKYNHTSGIIINNKGITDIQSRLFDSVWNIS